MLDHSMKQRVWIWQVWWYMIDWFDLPKLTTFTTGYHSFEYTTSLSLNSMMIYDWLIWSSWTHYIYYRRWFIQRNNKFEFGKHDDIWLIDLIFLNSLHSLLIHVLFQIQEVLLYQVPLLSPLHQMFLSQMDTSLCLLRRIVLVIIHSVTSPPLPSHLIQLHLR